MWLQIYHVKLAKAELKGKVFCFDRSVFICISADWDILLLGRFDQQLFIGKIYTTLICSIKYEASASSWLP